MQLILAIEPDRRQAAQVTAMVRAHLSAELVIAGSTAKALKALGERVPDLILTPALLPPADDTMLADRLRELGPAAGHIQAVTIPILSEAAGGEDQERGMLSALRRDRSRGTANEGCEPTVFVNQVAAYLQRAAQERQARTMVDDATREQPPADQPTSGENPQSAASAPELAEWIDIDQVMAAISVTPDQPVASAAPVASPTPPTPVASAPPVVVSSVAPPVVVSSIAPRVVASPPPQDHASSTRHDAREEEIADDQWVFFDPCQCGFPALLAKLESIAGADSAIS